MATISIKRIYDPPAASDGFRVLVDRVWPRGLSKDKAALDEWRKEVAPTTALRQWFGHRPERWDAFRRRYLAELGTSTAAKAFRAEMRKHRRVTLLYSARDIEHNQARVLAEFLGRGR